MFAQKNRLSKQKDFDNIFKNGKTIKSSLFKIIFLENSINQNRYSIIINKKVSKKAFLRNRLKRIIRKQIILFNFKKQNYDIIVIVFPILLEKVELVKNEIHKALSKINLY